MKIENLNLSYNENVIFSNFNLDIEDGKITTILGLSGVGKTTLLKCVSGLIKSNITPINSSFVFQEDRLISHLTVYQNLALIGYNEKDIKNGLERFGLIAKINEYPNHLSGGEKQRVNILRAFLKNSNLCLFDEPFSSLDILKKLDLLSLLKEEQLGKKKTFLYITHDIEESLLISDRIVVLGKNKILLDLSLPSTTCLRDYGSMQNERELLINSLK